METAPVQSTSLAILNDPQGSDHTKNYVSQTGRGLGSAVTRLQILVEGLPADAKLPGDFGLADAGRNPRAQLHDGRRGCELLCYSSLPGTGCPVPPPRSRRHTGSPRDARAR